jgi:hypothetical protein
MWTKDYSLLPVSGGKTALKLQNGREKLLISRCCSTDTIDGYMYWSDICICTSRYVRGRVAGLWARLLYVLIWYVYALLGMWEGGWWVCGPICMYVAGFTQWQSQQTYKHMCCKPVTVILFCLSSSWFSKYFNIPPISVLNATLHWKSSSFNISNHLTYICKINN